MDEGLIVFVCMIIAAGLIGIGVAIGYITGPGPLTVARTCEWQGYYNVNETKVIHCESMKKDTK